MGNGEGKNGYRKFWLAMMAFAAVTFLTAIGKIDADNAMKAFSWVIGAFCVGNGIEHWANHLKNGK
jgi:hypothetical protein